MKDERLNLPSASSIEALALCPGRWKMTRDLPETDPGDDANRGTEIHAILAGEIDGSAAKFPDSMETALALRKTAESLIAEWGNGDDRIVEHRVWLREGIRPIISGKPDLVVLDDMRALVIDFKTGWGDVEVSAANLQLRTLAVLVDSEYGGFSEITVAIVQTGHRPEPCVYSAGDIAHAETELRAILAAAKAPDAPLVPGETQCQYCRARATCPAATRELAEVAAIEPATQWPALSPGEKARLVESAKLAKKIAEEIEKRAKADLEADLEAVPGWTLKPGATRHTITHADEAYARLAHEMTVAEFTDLCTVPIGKLADLYYRKLKAYDSKTTKESAKQDFLDRLDGIVEETQNAPSLAKA